MNFADPIDDIINSVINDSRMFKPSQPKPGRALIPTIPDLRDKEPEPILFNCPLCGNSYDTPACLEVGFEFRLFFQMTNFVKLLGEFKKSVRIKYSSDFL